MFVFMYGLNEPQVKKQFDDQQQEWLLYVPFRKMMVLNGFSV